MSSVYSLCDSVSTEAQQAPVVALSEGAVLGVAPVVEGDKTAAPEWPSDSQLLRGMAFVLATRFNGVSDEDGGVHCSGTLLKHIDAGVELGLYSPVVAHGLADYMEGFFMENPEHVADMSDSDGSYVPSDTESDFEDDSVEEISSSDSEASSGFSSVLSDLTQTPFSSVVESVVRRTRSNSVASSVVPTQLDFEEASTVELPPAKRPKLLVKRAWPRAKALVRSDPPRLPLPVVIDLTEDSD